MEWTHNSREPSSTCVPGDVRISILALLTLCRCFIHGTTPQPGPDGSVGDGCPALDLPSLQVIRPLGDRLPIFLDWVVWMLGQSEWNRYWNRVGMQKSLSRDFPTNKNSWQWPLTSIINCYSPGHGKSCVVGHIWGHSGRAQGKLIGSLKGKQSSVEQEKSPCKESDHLTPCLIPGFFQTNRQRGFKISLYLSFMKYELFCHHCCSVADTAGLTVPHLFIPGRKWAWIKPTCLFELLRRKGSSLRPMFLFPIISSFDSF